VLRSAKSAQADDNSQGASEKRLSESRVSSQHDSFSDDYVVEKFVKKPKIPAALKNKLYEESFDFSEIDLA
jgi:hypothetical protein